MTARSGYPTVDHALARCLERVEGMAGAACVDARNALQPQAGAEWIEVDGAIAMFDGASSPLTQTFGLGLVESFAAPALDEIEDFFRRHGCPASHEVSSFVAPTALNMLSARGYSPIEASAVSVRPAERLPDRDWSRITVRVIDDADTDLWARVAADGLRSESQELGAFVDEFGVLMSRARNVVRFLAEAEGRPIATASLTLDGDVALFSGASTIPDARRQGAQLALLESRLAFAVEHEMELLMIVASPGTSSQRNAERQGFRPVYTRSKWQRKLEA